MGFFIFRARWWRWGGLLLAFILVPFHAPAPETDNFCLPLEPEFADLGNFLEAQHTRAIAEGVRKVNDRIERALKLEDPAARTRQLSRCHEPDAVARAVASRFGDPITEIVKIEHSLGGSDSRRNFPGKKVFYKNISMNLFGHFPLDPRALSMVGQAGTVRAFGTYFGTDKILHFHQVGYNYYKRYHSLLRKGYTPEVARQNVIKHFSTSGVFSEATVFGTLLTGVYSNGDLASDYAGLKFYLNLTERVRLMGEEKPPLVVRSGEFWRLNDHVRPQSGWFRPFITDHWNEALNPCLYDFTMRSSIRRIVRSRASHIIDFYTLRDGRPNDPVYFENLAQTLTTYYGESYGHAGSPDQLMNIGNTCYPAVKKGAPDSTPKKVTPNPTAPVAWSGKTQIIRK
jgi:hypothetical protein